MSDVADVARRARAASRAVQYLCAADRVHALSAVESGLLAARSEIEHLNVLDRREAAAGDVESSLQKRLDMSGAKFDALLAGVASVRSLADPVGVVTLSRKLDDGLELYRVSAPIGVLAVIFEARPEAGVQIASLAIKSGNVVILKGGSEAERSNRAIVKTIREALEKTGYPADTVQLLTTRTEVRELLRQTECVDLIIPRGSNKLVRFITEHTRIPVMGHADGLCAVYVDAKADVEKAVRIVLDAKTQYPAVCNAAETLIVDKGAMDKLLIPVAKALVEEGVTLKADEEALKSLRKHGVKVKSAEEEDFKTEFLDLTMAVKIVDGVEEAVKHINQYGSGHTDVIVSEDEETARKFMNGVDSAGVYHNVSSRFADGYRYGFGAEVGISTHRTHARGPVGVEGLMIYKYKMIGKGHVVRPYAEGKKSFKHEDFQMKEGEHCHLVG